MTPARILIVEDDFVVARDLRQQLLRLGYEVAGSTPRGEDAAALAVRNRADLVLADIRLEGPMDGTAAAREIRQQCDIPVVFLTAYADDDTLRRASQADAQGYLLKPFDTSQLRTAVEVALHRHAIDQKLRASESRYAATLASIGDAVISTGSDGRVSYMNPTAERLTGIPAAQAVGRPLADVFRVTEDDHGLPPDGGTGLLLAGPDGRQVPIEQTQSPIVDARGNLSGTVLVFRDLSARHAAEKALREAQAQLSRASGLMNMAELAASVAHEISQPMAAMVTQARAGLNWLRRPEPVLPEVELALAGIHAEGTRVTSVVHGLRAIARKSGTERVPLDLRSVVAEAVQMLGPELHRHGARLHLGPWAEGCTVLGDRIQLQQVLVNLLRNGLESLCEDASAPRQLAIRSACEPPGHLTVCVSDSGQGVAPVHAERLFEAFFTTKADGMGMGLAICRSIVEAHQGRIWARPRQPHGTDVCFTLPLAGT